MSGLPRASNIPVITANVQSLKAHSLLCIFAQEPSVTVEQRRLRTWLLHTIASAANHYLAARDLVSRQDNADQQRDGGAILYVLDVPEQLDGCITALFRACMAIRRMQPFEAAETFVREHEGAIGTLSSIRNQFDHMHSQIVANKTGSGPILMVFDDEGSSIQFRSLRIQTAQLAELIQGAFAVVASLFPGFNTQSPSRVSGPTKLTISATCKVIERDSRDTQSSTD
jgi:hypothetical protein